MFLKNTLARLFGSNQDLKYNYFYLLKYKQLLKVGQEIEVRPGVVSRDATGKFNCRPIKSKILSLYAEQNDLQYAVPGGLIGVGTKIDPELCRADRMVGHALGAVDSLPDIYSDIEISSFLLRRLLGVRTEGDQKAARVQKLQRGEILMLNIGSLSTGARVTAVKMDLAKLQLNIPVCTEIGEKVALSRRIDNHWRYFILPLFLTFYSLSTIIIISSFFIRLIGWGQIRKGTVVKPIFDL